MRLAPRLQIGALATSYAAGVVATGMAARQILEAIGPHPVAALAVYSMVLAAAALGGLVAFWFLLDRVNFLSRGYEVRFRDGQMYYEERDDASNEGRRLAFDWFPLTEGYRPRSLVRLPRSDTWHLDAPGWAQGRREDIVGRITKDLSSYEGWPALLMPDAGPVQLTEDNTASALIRLLRERWPEWTPHSASNAEAGSTESVLLSVPPPDNPSHRLEVARRAAGIEITYRCDERSLRAKAKFDLTDPPAALFCVCEFLREFRDGEMVVLVRPVPLLTRLGSADHARYRAEFRSVSPAVRYSRRLVYEWHADPKQS